MASILRSSKFVRYIAGFARNVVVNTPREFDGNLVNTATAQCYCGAIPRYVITSNRSCGRCCLHYAIWNRFVSRTLATQTSTQHDQNLDRRLRSLDQDVRKSGRISRRDIEDVLEEIRNARSATSSQSLLGRGRRGQWVIKSFFILLSFVLELPTWNWSVYRQNPQPQLVFIREEHYVCMYSHWHWPQVRT